MGLTTPGSKSFFFFLRNAKMLRYGLDYSPGLECMMPPSAKMVVAVR